MNQTHLKEVKNGVICFKMGLSPLRIPAPRQNFTDSLELVKFLAGAEQEPK